MGRPVIHDCFYEVNGIWGKGDPPPVAGCSSGTALILGSAACLWDDVRAAKDLGHHYIAVNDAGMYIHLAGAFTKFRLRHWASLESSFFPAYRIRTNGTQNHSVLYHSNQPDEGVDFAWRLQHPSFIGGTSSLFATLVALGLGYDPVILCGVPLDGSGYFYGPPESHGIQYNSCLRFWEKHLDVFKGRVKSMSGNTRELLGAPCL
jgi:hypothetical protein